MIHWLTDSAELPPAEVGKAIAGLSLLARGRVPVADAVVCTTMLFAEYWERGRIPDAALAEIVRMSGRDDFALHSRCWIRASQPCPYPGLAADIEVEKTPAAVRHALERLYRSWSSDRARAARLTRLIGEQEGMPAVIMRPAYSQTESLLTRAPETGLPTDEGNWRDAPRNTAARLFPDHVSALSRIDALLRRPCIVTFVATPPHRVIQVEEQNVSSAVAFSCQCEYLRAGLITEAEFVMRVEPSWYSVSPPVSVLGTDVVSFQGIGASGGMAIGRIAFSAEEVLQTVGSDPSTAVVLVRKEVSTEDISGIHAAVAVLTTTGGKASHAAVVCSKMGKVCVVGCGGLHINEQTQEIRYTDGVLGGSSFVFLNGQTGDAHFSSTPATLDRRVTLRAGIRTAVDQLLEVLATFKHPEAFLSLPLDAQARVGLHNRYLYDLGLI